MWYKAPKPELYTTQNFPVFILQIENDSFYGFPLSNSSENTYEKYGFKIGKYRHRRQNLSHEMLNIQADWRSNFEEQDDEVLGSAVKLMIKDAYGPVLKKSACIFTNTPDENFIIDPCPDPDYPCIALVSACSGHGFKFSCVVGEMMAFLVTENKPYPHSETLWLRANRFY